MLFGVKPRATVTAEGKFCCPQCQENTRYLRKQVNNYFTFLFIPIKRTNDMTLVDYVECSNCEKQFHLSPHLVLDGATLT